VPVNQAVSSGLGVDSEAVHVGSVVNKLAFRDFWSSNYPFSCKLSSHQDSVFIRLPF
jgi:hypothetical protein